MQVQVRTRADGGELRVDSYCPVCILRDLNTVKSERDDARCQRDECKLRLGNAVEGRDASMRAHGECIKQCDVLKRDNASLTERLAIVTQERDEARSERDGWRKAAAAWHKAAAAWQGTAKGSKDDAEKLTQERDEARALAESADAALTRSLNACDALKRDNASLTERLAIVTQERNTARADKDTHIRGGMYSAWANGTCIVHGAYQIAVAQGGAPAICCPECTRADLERQRDRAQSRANCAEEELKHARSERDDARKAADNARSERDEARKAADNAYNAGRDDAFEIAEDNLCMWARYMIRNDPS